MEVSQILLVIISILSIAGSAFSSFSELSLFIVDKVKLHKLMTKDKKKSRYLKKLLENHRETLITILFINLLFNTVISISMSSLLTSLNIILSTIIISFTILIFGEILPKIGGYSIAERMVLTISKIVYTINLIGKPMFKFVDEKIILPFVRPTRYISKREKAELIEVLKRNTKNPKLKKFIQILDFDVKDIMIPINDVILMNIHTKLTVEEIKKIKPTLGYVLFYENSKTNIIGASQIGKLLSSLENPKNLIEYIEPVIFVPETKKIYDLFIEFKNKKLMVSVVVDEYGNIIGVITPKIIFEYIFSSTPTRITKISKDYFVMDGDISLKEFNEFFETDLESQFYNTISGFIIENLGRIPEKGEKITLKDLTIIVEDVKDGKIEKVSIKVS